MVCAQAQYTLDEALRLMVERAQRDHVRLDTIAAAVTEGVVRFGRKERRPPGELDRGRGGGSQ
jgi:hypothetical protein